jgi:hypothetical protein
MPVAHHDAPVGRLVLAMPRLATGSQRRRQLLVSFCQQAGAAFDHARLEASLRASAGRLEEVNDQLVTSRQRLLAAKDIGRRQVASTIQRDVVRPLESVVNSLQVVSKVAVADPVAAGREVDVALASTSQAIEQLRRITSTVFSRVLVHHGLVAALRAEPWRPGQPLEVLGPPLRWSPAVESCLFACCLDLARAGTGPARLEVSEDRHDQAALLSFTSAALPPQPQWLAMTRERIEVLGGHVEQPSQDRVVLRVPLSYTDLAPA